MITNPHFLRILGNNLTFRRKGYFAFSMVTFAGLVKR